MHLLKGSAFTLAPRIMISAMNGWTITIHPFDGLCGESRTLFGSFEVLRYGEDCIIVVPEIVQMKLQRKLQALCNHYGLIQE